MKAKLLFVPKQRVYHKVCPPTIDNVLFSKESMVGGDN